MKFAPLRKCSGALSRIVFAEGHCALSPVIFSAPERRPGRGAAHEEEVIPKLGGKVARGLERCFANAILGPLKLLRRSKVIRTYSRVHRRESGNWVLLDCKVNRILLKSTQAKILSLPKPLVFSVRRF